MEELDIKELFNIFWNKKIIIILITIVFIIFGVVYSKLLKKVLYTASTTLVLVMADNNTKDVKDSTTITTTDVTLNSKLISTYSELVKSNNVIREVVSNLDFEITEEEIRDNVVVTAIKDTELIKIAVSNVNAEYTAAIANEIAKVFSEKINEIYNINNIYIVDYAESPKEPSNVSLTKDVLLFAIIGVMISAIYVIIQNMLDDTIKTVEDIEGEYGLPVLATISMVEDFNVKKGGESQL